jgi:hypothetical protein
MSESVSRRAVGRGTVAGGWDTRDSRSLGASLCIQAWKAKDGGDMDADGAVNFVRLKGQSVPKYSEGGDVQQRLVVEAKTGLRGGGGVAVGGSGGVGDQAIVRMADKSSTSLHDYEMQVCPMLALTLEAAERVVGGGGGKKGAETGPMMRSNGAIGRRANMGANFCHQQLHSQCNLIAYVLRQSDFAMSAPYVCRGVVLWSISHCTSSPHYRGPEYTVAASIAPAMAIIKHARPLGPWLFIREGALSHHSDHGSS